MFPRSEMSGLRFGMCMINKIGQAATGIGLPVMGNALPSIGTSPKSTVYFSLLCSVQ